MNIDWSKAPEGYPFWIVDNLGIYPSGWFRETAGQTMYVNDGGIRWSKNAEHKDRIAVFHKPDTWNGEGLPPVGAWAEVPPLMPKNTPAGNYPYVTVEVLAYGDKTVFLRDNRGSEHLRGLPLKFYPIRTSEQVTAIKREQALKELTYGYKNDILRDWAVYVYDTLGYRKQVKS